MIVITRTITVTTFHDAEDFPKDQFPTLQRIKFAETDITDNLDIACNAETNEIELSVHVRDTENPNQKPMDPRK
jgi:hypothetical protein